MPERTDRELLELAAKAAGHKVHIWGEKGRENCAIMDVDVRARWNPLTDDGDALRLAVKLEISTMVSVISSGRSRSKKWNVFTPNSGYDKGKASELFGLDPCASYRRAIVRAAAEIGANMQS